MLESVSVLLFASVTDVAVQAFVNAIIGLMIFAVLILPVLIIPYVFIKLGSVAGKVQSFMNNTAKGKGVLGKAAYGAAGRGIERKAGKWAARGDGSLRSRVGGYKTQRDFKRSQRSAEAKRLQEEGLAKRITSDSAYQQAAGGQRAVAVARGIQEKRLKEEDENATATLRAAGIYHPEQLTKIAEKSEAVGVTGEKVNGASSEALQRVAMRQLISAQDSGALNQIISTDSAADKTMLYEEIQKQYSTAKGAGAHFVKFDPGAELKDANNNVILDRQGQSIKLDANGWDANRIKSEAVNSLGSLSFEKLVAQDSAAAKSAWSGFAEGKGSADARAALQAAAREAIARPEILKGAKLDVRVALEGIASGTPPPAPTPRPQSPPNPPTPPSPPPTGP